jgi:cell division protein FtsB
LGERLLAGSKGLMTLKEIREISSRDVLAYAKKNTRQILALALFALFVHDIFGPHGFIAMRRTQKEIDQIHEQIVKMNEQNKSMTGQVSSLKSDPKSIERIAREEMGLARPGEMIFKIPDAPKEPSK